MGLQKQVDSLWHGTVDVDCGKKIQSVVQIRRRKRGNLGIIFHINPLKIYSLVDNIKMIW